MVLKDTSKDFEVSQIWNRCGKRTDYSLSKVSVHMDEPLRDIVDGPNQIRYPKLRYHNFPRDYDHLSSHYHHICTFRMLLLSVFL